MSFTEAVQTCFRKYAVFTGRARRSEYWWWLLFSSVGFTFGLFNALGSVVIYEIGPALFRDTPAGTTDTDSVVAYYAVVVFGFLASLAGLALVLPTLAVGVRRLHDTGRSGWFLLIGLIPIVGAIILLVFLARPGNLEANQYGEAPA